MQMKDEKIRLFLEDKGLEVTDTLMRNMVLEGLGILIGGQWTRGCGA